MKNNLYLVMMMATLVLWGCSQEEKQAEAPPPATMPAVEQAVDTAKEATKSVAKPVEKTTETVEKKMAQQVAAGQKNDGETAAQGSAASAKLTTTVESVAIDNKNGTVVLPHKKHAEAYGCTVCHGAKKPGPQKLGKAAAHALCQGCHKEKKGGPTSCPQCHQKKAKALEGC